MKKNERNKKLVNSNTILVSPSVMLSSNTMCVTPFIAHQQHIMHIATAFLYYNEKHIPYITKY
jgi:hypothetical protein